MKTILITGIIAICTLLQSFSYAKVLKPLGSFISLPEDILAAEDISAIAKFASFVVVGSDEASGKKGDNNYIQFLTATSDGSYMVHSNILLFKGNKKEGKEMDIEGLAVEGNYVYVLGSHSSKRQKISKNKKYKKNKKKFYDSKIKDEKNRDWLYRLTLDSNAKVIDKEKITLRKIIKKDKVLKSFSHIPSKENGIDIEGIAVKNGWMYLGFRGPVFRENYVPVMKLKFKDPKNSYQLLYLTLAGRGIRDMVSVANGFLIIAGPVGDGDSSYQLYHWDGKDMIPGKNRKRKDIGRVKLLGEIIPPKGGKAEGLVVMQEDKSKYQLIISYDGIKNMRYIMQHFRVTKP
ncbi:MAG: DUF3616 domain-containing protein [Pseudomonadota bacterium]